MGFSCAGERNESSNRHQWFHRCRSNIPRLILHSVHLDRSVRRSDWFATRKDSLRTTVDKSFEETVDGNGWEMSVIKTAPLVSCVNCSRSDEFERIRSKRVLINIARSSVSFAVVFVEIENEIGIIDQWCFNTTNTTNKHITSSPTKNKDKTDEWSWHRQRAMETHRYSIEVRFSKKNFNRMSLAALTESPDCFTDEQTSPRATRLASRCSKRWLTFAMIFICSSMSIWFESFFAPNVHRENRAVDHHSNDKWWSPLQRETMWTDHRERPQRSSGENDCPTATTWNISWRSHRPAATVPRLVSSFPTRICSFHHWNSVAGGDNDGDEGSSLATSEDDQLMFVDPPDNPRER